MSIKVKKAKLLLEEMNQLFKERKISDERFYNQLENFGVEIEKATLVSWFPDDVAVIAGRLINQSGLLCFFDINLDDPKYSKFEPENISDDIKYRRKPWDPDFIAYNMHVEKLKSRGQST